MTTVEEIFKLPEKETKIWRYMNLEKFLYLIQNSSLYFPSALELSRIDPWEGSLTKINIEYLLSEDPNLKDLNPDELKREEEARKSFFKWRENLTPYTHINSWHANNYESDAMWKIYGGIAIQSTTDRLKDQLSSKNVNKRILIGQVNYIDYYSEGMDETNCFIPFIHKRKAFEHEKEIRAIYLNEDFENPNKGTPFKVKLENLIEKIYISPLTDNHIKGSLEDLLKRYHLNIKIIKSGLLSKRIL